MTAASQRKTRQSKYRPLPCRDELLRWLRYCPETGRLYRIARKKGGPGANGERILLPRPSIIGKLTAKGYLVVQVLGETNLQVSRVAWRIQTGQDPGAKEIDHINGDKSDNRWINLRIADHAENRWNAPRGSQAHSPLSPYKGVTHWKDENGDTRYIRARIMVRGKRLNLGKFATDEEAYAAYCEAAKRYHGEFAKLV